MTPEGFSVDVMGASVVLTFPEHDIELSPRMAVLVAEQLRLAGQFLETKAVALNGGNE